MEIDLEKKVKLVDAFEMIVKLSEKYLDADSTNDLKDYFDKTIETEEIFADEGGADLERLGRTSNLISELLSNIPKRIERLSELRAPQVIIDFEIAALESIKKINSNLC